MSTPIRATAAALLATTLLASGCGPQAQATITDEPTALEAIADSFAGSWRWSGAVDVAVHDDDLTGLAAMDPYYADHPEDGAEEIRQFVEESRRSRMHGALGDDGSFQTTWQRDDIDLIDLRIGLGELLSAETLTPHASLYAQFDVPALVRLYNEFSSGRQDPAIVIREAEEGARREIPEPDLLAAALALIHGEWGGLAGPVDLSMLEIVEADLPQMRDYFRQELIGVAGRDTMVALLDEAITVRDLRPADGGTTVATIDVHPRAAAFAVYDLFDDADALASSATGIHEQAEDYPEALTDVATITFDARGNVVEVRTDVIELARQVAAAFPETPAEALTTLDSLHEDTYAAVVFGFSDHDEVATVLDVDATTAGWHDLFESFFGGLARDAAA